MKEYKSIKELYIGNNKLTSSGGTFIANNLPSTELEILSLGGNKIQKEGLTALLSAISFGSKITHLDLSDNDFTLDDFEKISGFLKEDPEIVSLNLSKNNLDGQKAYTLGLGLQKLSKLKKLNLSEMGIIPDVSGVVFFNGINCEELIVDNNILQDVGFMILSKCLMRSKNIKRLSMKNTKIGSIGVSHMVIFIGQCKNLEELHLEGNVLNEGDSILLSDAIKTQPNLKVFIKRAEVSIEKVQDNSSIILVD